MPHRKEPTRFCQALFVRKTCAPAYGVYAQGQTGRTQGFAPYPYAITSTPSCRRGAKLSYKLSYVFTL